MLVRPLLAAGTIVVAFGVVCVWDGTGVVSPVEAEGFKIIGIRYLTGGLFSISLPWNAFHTGLVSTRAEGPE